MCCENCVDIPQVLPHPVIHPSVSGLLALAGIFPPVGLPWMLLEATTEMSLGVKPGPVPYSGCCKMDCLQH